jgi:8-oxo-dGTP diphosphatase
VEPGETPEQCLKRELQEEFGIDAEVGEFLCSSSHAYAHSAITLLAYKTLLVAGAFTLHEHAEIRWVKPEDLTGFDLSEADMPIAEHVKEHFADK